jgi:hypothetical protein
MKDAWKNWGRTVVLWGLAGLAVGCALSLPIPGAYVDHAEHDGVDHNYSHRIPVSLIVYVFDWFARNKEGVEALSGVFVAGFTFTLWRATDKLWDATNAAVKVSERALIENERPWIFRGIVTIRWRDKDAMKPNDWWVSIAWKNVGRMPALIDRIEFKIKDKKTLPSAPDYDGADMLAFIPSLAQDQEHETGEVGVAKARDDSGAVIEYVFFGRVIYREMNGTERHSGFAISLSPHFPAAVEFNNAAYNYYT